MIGTASEAIAKLGFGDAEAVRLQANIVTAYSVSYLFGLITIVLYQPVRAAAVARQPAR